MTAALRVPRSLDRAARGGSHRVVTTNQIVSIHTKSGAQAYQFAPTDQATFNWTREGHDVSTFDLSVPPIGDSDRLPEVHPWQHWASVWDGDNDRLLWKGPVFKSVANKAGLQLSCRDPAAYLSRTRCPITKRWDAADPAWIARELWEPMMVRHGIGGSPTVLTDPAGDRYDFHCIADEQMLDATVKELVDLGLFWTTVAGSFVLGPAPRNIIASLGEADFTGDTGISVVRDGSQVFNDVLVRVPGDEVRDRLDYGDQNLETIVTLDSISQVSSVARAARSYLRQTAVVRADLDLPSGVTLADDAPVTIDDLIPSTRYWITAQGVSQEVELESVSVDGAPGSATVKVTMRQVIETPELTEGGPTQTLGGQTLPPGLTS
ncbi:minor tail protein [Mycobacterium phage LilMcDreamy]|uniref:Minor tail protein n=1 Tax=Mycobacterium phage LilMcDreamy TaxID=2652422 RepID=A0A5P8D6J3_9CAUD|nr:minor tail protein [Mycobacterium phage LilMcDreamy]QFP94646.1 minor tail protein [Mycobacterium phage LilMcDreamy]